MKIWQVAAGDGGRDYSRVFKRYGVMLIGPGTEGGDYPHHKDAYNNPDKPTYRPAMRLFADKADDEAAKEDDLVVLKRPSGTKWEAVAVGKISSGYSFESVFSDVEDFQLQHCRHVRWKRPTGEAFICGLARGTFLHVNNERAREAVVRLWAVGKRIPAHPIPSEPEEVNHDNLIHSLTAEGLRRERAKCIPSETMRLQRLAKWYYSTDEDYDVGEHEARTFLVVPLIKSLGWNEKQVKIEWKHKDVVLFDRPYSGQNTPGVIIETKRLWDGLGGAPEQAEEYAKGYPACDRLVVTDGIRYKLFTKRKHSGKFRFCAYLKLLALARRHPYEPDVEGADSFLLKMLPNAALGCPAGTSLQAA